jgi:rhodanese-related sulfurtransferase
MKTAAQVFQESRQRVREVSGPEALALAAEGAVVIDCREPNEWNLGHVPGALHIPRGILESNIEAAVPRDRRILLYCASGNRSALAAESLAAMGYGDVVSLRTGFRGWVDAGGDVDG